MNSVDKKIGKIKKGRKTERVSGHKKRKRENKKKKRTKEESRE